MPAKLSLAYITAGVGIVLTPVLWSTLSSFVRHSLITKSTILNDIPDLGKPGKRGERKLRGTAIICGGRLAF